MVFNSLEFLVFLVAALVLHHVVLRPLGWRTRKVVLAVVSVVFYASWSPSFALLLLGSAVWVVLGAVSHLGTPAARVRARFVGLPAWLQGVAYGVGAVAGYLLAPTSERFIYFQF